MLKSALVALAFTLGMSGGAVANSSHNTATRSIAVSYADLNVASPEGAHTLLRRINRAAKTACDGTPFRVGLHQAREIRACIAEAERNAVTALDVPLVTALYEERRPWEERIAQAPAH